MAIILDIGYVISGGRWVEDHHYIEPATQPIFDDLAKEFWNEIKKL